MEDFNIGDIIYIIKHHRKNNKTTYYIEKGRICNYSYWYRLYYVKFKDINNSDLDSTTKYLNVYKRHRLFKTLEEAEKELELKNKELVFREEYTKNIKELRK